MEARVLPVGIQSFETIREQNYLYIDKTAIIYKIVSKYCPYFLSRPRRFGKSLLINTIKAYFEGRKDLFKGLAMETLEKDWTVYPVLKFDMSGDKNQTPTTVKQMLSEMLEDYEKQYGIPVNTRRRFANRLTTLIKTAQEQTGQKVVVLIDEYDAPMLDSVGDEKRQNEIRAIMRGFFSPLKAQADHLRFVFLTGITKFSQLSIFSELNNLRNISMLDDFSAICGITKTELLTKMQPEIEVLADANHETYEEACEHLRQQYDGYHFSAKGEDIFNPFSIVNVLSDRSYNNYWFASGTPTFLLELMKHQDLEITDLRDLSLMSDDFDAPTEFNPDAIAVLYQSGYLTIKGYNESSNLYKLDMPNNEVRRGFSDFLLKAQAPYYTRQRRNMTAVFNDLLRKDDVDGFLQQFKEFLSGFPYNLGENSKEKHYQTILYTVLTTIGMTVNTEVTTADGRIDMTVSMPQTNYIFEFKLNKTAKEAFDQINEKNYASHFATDTRKLIKVGVNFSTQTRTIDGWVVR